MTCNICELVVPEDKATNALLSSILSFLLFMLPVKRLRFLPNYLVELQKHSSTHIYQFESKNPEPWLISEVDEGSGRFRWRMDRG